MFNLLFASGHGGSTKEISQLCKKSGVQLVLPGEATRELLSHLVKDADAQQYSTSLLATADEIKQAIVARKVHAWLVARPESIEKIRENFGSDIPIIARHSINSFDKYKKLGLKNFISPSRTALRQMNAPNQWLSVKARNFSEAVYAADVLSARERRGYFSYIHHYSEYWKRAYGFFSEIVNLVDGAVPIENFGKGTTKGIVDDDHTMAKSKATLHIKDGQVCCNAPINSIALGIPVLMDYETLQKLGLQDYIIHQVSGLLFDTPQECVRWIQILENDPEYLDELSKRTKTFARLKCQYSSQDYLQFRKLLHKALV
jgi:hypothetical protein